MKPVLGDENILDKIEGWVCKAGLMDVLGRVCDVGTSVSFCMLGDTSRP